MKLVKSYYPAQGSNVIIRTKSYRELLLVKYESKRFGEYFRNEILGWRYVRTERDKAVKEPAYSKQVIDVWNMFKYSLGEIPVDYPFVVPRKFEIDEYYRKSSTDI